MENSFEWLGITGLNKSNTGEFKAEVMPGKNPGFCREWGTWRLWLVPRIE
jgi:hypothetical protein